MPISNRDLQQAKAAIVNRLLAPALHSHVIARTATLRVADAVAMAGRNVHAVGIGEKISEGKKTGQRCVRIYVVQKLAESLLPPRDLLPEEIDGVPVDVVQSPPAFVQAKRRPSAGRPGSRRSGSRRSGAGRAGSRGRAPAVSAAAAAASCTTNRQKEQRPLVAGISAAHFDVTAGTIGYFCRSTLAGDDPHQVHLLSNNHVLANVNLAELGGDVYQPGPADGGKAIHLVADLHRFVPIVLDGTATNAVDCALAAIRPAIAHRLEVCSIGRITARLAAAEGLNVRMHGRTTGLSEGEITDINYTTLVGMDHLDPSVVARFENQIRIEPTGGFAFFGLGGDSGSLVVAKASPSAVGLYFAGPDSGEYGVANHITAVEAELQAELLL